MVPILLLGSFSILLTQRYIVRDLDQKNAGMLSQAKDNIAIMLNEMDTLSISYQTIADISVPLKSILDSEKLTYEQVKALDIISSYIKSPANARPYIDSIYVYYNNPYRHILTSTDGLTKLERFPDKSWFDRYLEHGEGDSWLERRSINRFDIGDKPVITLYRKLYTPGAARATGVLVLNLDPAYVNGMLREIALYPEQKLLVLDGNRTLLFSANLGDTGISEDDLAAIVRSREHRMTLDIDGKSHVVTRLSSDRHGLELVSAVPRKVLYSVPNLLGNVTLALLAISFVLGVLISYSLTKRNRRNLKAIVSLIKAAQNGQALPEMNVRVSDEYGFILQNMIKTFLEQSYLKTHLSERTYRLKYMEMLALQVQINPHFLYNTLEIIYWKTLGLTGRPNEASQMIEHLSDILKFSLSSPQSTVVLDKELEFTKIYLEIQKIRNKDKFEMAWEVEPNVLHLPVLKLILQPIVENSIEHGIKLARRKGCIKIKIRQIGPKLRIGIVDNGIGMPRERLTEVNEKLRSYDPAFSDRDLSASDRKMESIGLYNTHKRLQLHYGDAYGIRIVGKSGWGTKVEITLPAGSAAPQDQLLPPSA
ncbi:sensor histidine kinase [Cohnella cellulosilytica]|uniref:Sensor histidine kinase n=2 Tax=Cohnella cellulosilytica TaxID=986710 RepID=A0ABW2F4Q1_9BACL